MTETASVTAKDASAGTTITAKAGATAAAMQVDVVFTIQLTDQLQPTLESDGKTYVVQNNKVVVADPQPAESERIGDSYSISVTNIYYTGTTDPISEEDGRGLASAPVYTINLKGGNGFPGVRLDGSLTDKDASAATFNAVVNDANGVDVGHLHFGTTNPHLAASCSITKLDDTSGLETLYYSYNPQYHGAANDTQTETETTGQKSVSVTVTLTAVTAG